MRKSFHYGPGKRMMAAALALLMMLSLGGFALRDEAQPEPEPMAEEGTPNIQVTLERVGSGEVAAGSELQYNLTVTNTGNTELSGLTLEDEHRHGGAHWQKQGDPQNRDRFGDGAWDGERR